MDLFSSVEQRQPGLAPDGGRMIDVDALEPGDEVERRGPSGLAWWRVEEVHAKERVGSLKAVELRVSLGPLHERGVFLAGQRIWARPSAT